ncbi:asparaginase [Pseudomonas sp. Leaf127]|uniref:asparaginase n=1 Tax=Pseudomonas sp. Leaf127 TaxID=1736267 RepID=UPI0007036D38|nr:asparaginase [Pseudomonas sp. Leaf127]KQQ54549.1 asparaginase [Pseudomonas sp. Leaf127]
MQANNVALVTYRGHCVENVHRAHVAVVDEAGRLLYSFGDPQRMTLARSAAKPAQALAVIETGALERFGFDEADLALMCASHSSEPRHIERAWAMLRKVGADESDLRCGGHPAVSDAVNRAWIKRDFIPTACCSNCSGKHAGMLAAALALGESFSGYNESVHPLQAHVRRVMADVCELPVDAVEWAVDGCNLPTPAFALDKLGLIYARLAQSADAAHKGEPLSARGQALARIYRAMTTYPEMVAGEGRYCTDLMRAFEGNVVGKTGADACYGLGVRASAQTRRLGASGAVGLSVKVEDGNTQMLYRLVCEILERLAIGTAQQRQLLDKYHRPLMLNTVGQETGSARFMFDLHRH